MGGQLQVVLWMTMPLVLVRLVLHSDRLHLFSMSCWFLRVATIGGRVQIHCRLVIVTRSIPCQFDRLCILYFVSEHCTFLQTVENVLWTM